MHLPRGQLGLDCAIALMAVDGLPPNLGRQGVLLWSGAAPPYTLGYIIHSGLDFGWQWQRCAFLHSVMNVPIWVVAQQTPHGTLGRKGNRASLPCLIEKKRNDGVLGNVLGDVFLGVVRTHLFLIDVLLEDVAEDVRVDLTVVAIFALVQVPVVLLKEVEELFESLIRDDYRPPVQLFDLVLLKQTAIQIWNLTEQLVGSGRTVYLLSSEALEKERTKELAVIGVRLLVPTLGKFVS